jgi:pimeloyl-ACP methyl ester carboxylesterase
VAVAAARAANTAWVDAETRPASARDGGEVVQTDVKPANVKAEGDGPPLLLVHGFGAALDWWDGVAPALAARRRVIHLDLIGHGGTAAPRSGYAIGRQARLAAAALDKLGVGRVSVVGHSMGGEVATAFAELDPGRVERLILIDSPPTPGTTFTVLTEAYLTPVLGKALSRFRTADAVRRGLAQGFAPGFAVPERFVVDLERLTYSAFRQAHAESVAYRTARPTDERLAALSRVPPLLVIFGSLDAIVPPDHARLFERVPGAKVVMIEGAGHSPMVERPAETVKLIEGVLE